MCLTYDEHDIKILEYISLINLSLFTVSFNSRHPHKLFRTSHMLGGHKVTHQKLDHLNKSHKKKFVDDAGNDKDVKIVSFLFSAGIERHDGG